ncbi:hypothetical protein BKA69DRAFT_1126912 [Paraphysoderma sedebokerense]|nr:hypothetical protein BKA69DRAFT_1126912 [Paraphysoderma sedebokerense]
MVSYDAFNSAQQVLSKKCNSSSSFPSSSYHIISILSSSILIYSNQLNFTPRKDPKTPLKLCKLYSTPTQIQSWSKTIIPSTFSVHYDSFEITETNHINQIDSNRVGMVEYYLKKLDSVGTGEVGEQEERVESDKGNGNGKGKGKGKEKVKGKGKRKGKKESEVIERAGVLVSEWGSENGYPNLKLKLPPRYFRDITFRCYDSQSTFRRLLDPPIWSSKLQNPNFRESFMEEGEKGEEWTANLKEAVYEFRVRKDGVVVTG